MARAILFLFSAVCAVFQQRHHVVVCDHRGGGGVGVMMAVKHVVVLCFRKGIMLLAVTIVGVGGGVS